LREENSKLKEKIKQNQEEIERLRDERIKVANRNKVMEQV